MIRDFGDKAIMKTSIKLFQFATAYSFGTIGREARGGMALGYERSGIYEKLSPATTTRSTRPIDRSIETVHAELSYFL